MIESITMVNNATFGAAPEALNGLSQFNYLFGSNGTGKTTISRVIADEDGFPDCTVTWQGGTKLEPMVYNPDFVDRNFRQPAELKGVFTLGEKQVDTLARIAKAKAELDVLTTRIETLTLGLQGPDGAGGKKGELATLETGLVGRCWAQKQKHDAHFQGAFERYRGSAERFRDKVLEELASNVAPLLSVADLQTKAKSVFGPTPTVEASVALVDTAELLAHETNSILKKRLIGKEDVDVAAMIKKLGNSDWVSAGRTFYEVNGEVCPFCQQTTSEAFTLSLNEYFDEAFVTDSKAIDDLATDYAKDAARLRQQLTATIASPSKFLDVESLKAEKQLLDAKITLSSQRLVDKRKESSHVVELEPLGNVLASIKLLVDSANTQTADHNRMVANLETERSTLTAQVWKYVLEELKTDLVAFKTARGGINKAIASMTGKIATATTEKEKKADEIRELEKQTTSIEPTIDGINAFLSSFGFRGFKLAKAADGASYKLVRSDGSDAKATLSEGEKAFVAFLYFYHLLKGSESDSGMTMDRIVVFDDPVSSLDSDVLFIVSSLIRGLIGDVRAGTGHIKQVFVFTHNVYFHKEVTFNPRRRTMHGEETFWVIRKPDLVSKVEKHDANPIKTSYGLLWAEVRRSDRSNLTIQNTLRRILESYFKLLGGVDPDQICDKFEGREKLICKSLFGWVNDGSHFAYDDICVSISSETVGTYLTVFEAIFEKMDHSGHYRMMMADYCAEDPEQAATA